MPNDENVFEVDELYVLPLERSKGYGKELMSYVEETIKERHSYMFLSTSTKNFKAILHFYVEEAGMTFWSAQLFKKL